MEPCCSCLIKLSMSQVTTKALYKCGTKIVWQHYFLLQYVRMTLGYEDGNYDWSWPISVWRIMDNSWGGGSWELNLGVLMIKVSVLVFSAANNSFPSTTRNIFRNSRESLMNSYPHIMASPSHFESPDCSLLRWWIMRELIFETL